MSVDFRQVTEWVARQGHGLPVIEVSVPLARELQTMWSHLALEATPWHVLTSEGPVLLRLRHASYCRCAACQAVAESGELWLWNELRQMPQAQQVGSKSPPRRRASDTSQVRPLPPEPPELPKLREKQRSKRKTVPPAVPRISGLPPAVGRRFVVTIFYQEPTYAMRRGIPAKTYRGSFTVTARSEAEAKRRARHLFEEAAKTATVSWPREIVRTECRAA